MRDDSSRGSRRLVRLKHARTNGTVDVLASTGPRWQKLRRAWINACRVRARLRPRLSDLSVSRRGGIFIERREA